MIDSHHHFWNYTTEEFGWISDDMSVLRRDYLADDLHNAIPSSTVEQVISVQARCSEAENQFLLDQAKQSNGLVTGIVGWAPLTQKDLRRFLDPYLQEPLLKGIREIIQGTPDEAFLNNADFDAGIRELTHHDLAYDLLISHEQLPAAIEFVDRHPNQRIVLDHCGKPPIRKGEFCKTWALNIRELARRPHVYCKFSGLTTEIQDNSTPSAELFSPYFETLLKAFSPERIMYGSDWPVSLLATSYQNWVNIVETLLSPLSETEKSAILQQTANSFYKIS